MGAKIITASFAVILMLFSWQSKAIAADANDFKLAEAELSAAADGDLLSWYFDAMSRLPGFQSGGLTPDHKSLKFYWHGELSPDAQRIIFAAEESGRNVEIVFTKYSEQEVLMYCSKVFDALTDAGITVTGYGPSRDNSKIELRGPSLSPGNPEADLAEKIADQILPAGIKLSILEGSHTPITFESRHLDTGSPTPGGEINTNFGSCTGGLGVTRPGYGQYLLTAAHCFSYQNGQAAYISGNTNVGYSTFISTLFGAPNTSSPAGYQLDAALISYVTSGSAVDSQFFMGPNDTSTKVNFDRTGNIPWDVNMCSSGAATGLRCNISRTSGQTLNCILFQPNSTVCAKWAHVVGVSSAANQIMFGSGDSGGPIYYVSSLTAERVVVALVQGSSGGTVPCGSISYYYNPQNPSSSQCSITNGQITALWTIWQQLSNNGYTVVSNTN